VLGKRLNYGDTIGLVAPAGIANEDKIEKGINKLESMGFKVKEGKSIYKKWGYFAGQDRERAEDIMDMFEDKSVDMILCVRGGYGSMRLLPYLNISKIRKNPKIFMGYSDITALLNYINQKTGLITFHGPMLTSDFDNEYTRNSFIGTIMMGYNNYSIVNPCNIGLLSNSDKTVEGKIVGGNLSLICGTLGTKYEIDTKDNILFIEEVGESPYKIDRMVTQLILSEKLKECEGIILGQFTECEDSSSGFSLNEVIQDRLLSLNKPVFMNLASGHDNPNLTLPIGAKSRLSCREGFIEVTEAVVK
jgi:muramoyltetrapeptide carboxypeptidase